MLYYWAPNIYLTFIHYYYSPKNDVIMSSQKRAVREKLGYARKPLGRSRLKNPKNFSAEKLTEKAFIRKLRFYVTGTNLFCLTKYSGYDPEVDTRRATPLTPGVDYSAYPKSIGCVFGLNLTF